MCICSMEKVVQRIIFGCGSVLLYPSTNVSQAQGKSIGNGVDGRSIKVIEFAENGEQMILGIVPSEMPHDQGGVFQMLAALAGGFPSAAPGGKPLK